MERNSRKKKPNPVDRHVGSRVRERRVELGMTQAMLGDALGLTFQQVQKYEKGINRIGVSTLFVISKTLHVPVTYFFEGLLGHLGFAEDSNASYVADFPVTPEGPRLIQALARIHDPKIRKAIVDLVSSLAGDDESPGRDDPPEEPETIP